jgi:hypothetical protein
MRNPRLKRRANEEDDGRRRKAEFEISGPRDSSYLIWLPFIICWVVNPPFKYFMVLPASTFFRTPGSC